MKIILEKLSSKDKRKVLIINKKIKQIIECDPISIDRYKNCRYDLSDYKRVHVNSHFVMTFKVNKDKNFILFEDFGHHDDIFGK